MNQPKPLSHRFERPKFVQVFVTDKHVVFALDEYGNVWARTRKSNEVQRAPYDPPKEDDYWWVPLTVERDNSSREVK